jgi:hypothetical protein
LARDETLVARFEKALERLPPYPTSEGIDQVVVDVEGAPSITYNISVPATPVFPCDVVTWQSPKEERDLFTRTIEQLKWNGNNATVMLAVARARLSMTGAQEWLRNEVEQRTRPNGTMSLNRLRPHYNFNDFGHYSEQFGVGLAISELLVQSVADVIRIFPALTPGCKAACENLRTQGGFLVSAKGRGESVDSLTITSTVGGPLRLLSPWPSLAVRRDERGEYEPLTLDERGLIELQTKPGETLEFRPRIPEAPGR